MNSIHFHAYITHKEPIQHCLIWTSANVSEVCENAGFVQKIAAATTAAAAAAIVVVVSSIGW